MTLPFVDTDVLIRLLTGDDPVKQAASAALFSQVEAGALTVASTESVIADAVFVLSSPRLYRVPRPQIREMLVALVRLPSFRVRHRRDVLRALDLYATTGLDFGDALIVATMEQRRARILYSYDGHFDRILAIERREP